MHVWPGVQQLDPGDAAGRDVEIRVGRDDDRTLAAQLEGDRGQRRRRTGHDLAADLGTAGKERMIEAQREQLLGDLPVALDDRDRLGIEVLGNQAGQQRRRRRASPTA